MLRVAQMGFFSDPLRRRPARLLEDWPSLAAVAEAAVSSPEVSVAVIQASIHREQIERGGVPYHFMPCGHRDSTAAGRAALAAVLRRIAPDVLHVHGLGFSRQLQALKALLPSVPILVQDHASRPPRLWRRPVWRRALAGVAGVAFCAREQARPFQRLGLIRSPTTVFEIPESTSGFTPGDREAARAATGLDGDPCLLWVGHLDANKDPLTVLEAVAVAARRLPDLQLWCCFGSAPLMPRVLDRLASDPVLGERVHLLGRVPHARIEPLMRAADFFVLGSHREGSGYALIEALACGLPPLVTDIPSFRALTGGGRLGCLWRCGEAASLARILLDRRAAAAAGADTRAAVRAHFEAELSSAAIGRKLHGAYTELVRHSRLTARA